MLLPTACTVEPAFEAPWEQAAPTERRLSGSFDTTIDGTVPGRGTFVLDGAPDGDLARATVTDVDGSWPVVQVQVLARQDPGWRVVELDVAQSAWVAGSIPLDGTSAIGLLREADGSEHYLMGGNIELRRTGLEPGTRISGTFADIQLLEGQP